jgi:hypothetical protein
MVETPHLLLLVMGLALAAAIVAVGSLLVRSDGGTLAVQAASGVPALTSKRSSNDWRRRSTIPSTGQDRGPAFPMS